MTDNINKETQWCQWPRCQKESDLVYLGKGLCDKHWTIGSEMPTEELHKKLGIEEKKHES